MKTMPWQMQDSHVQERYMLSLERIKKIPSEDTVAIKFRRYFTELADYICMVGQVYELAATDKWASLSLEEMQEINEALYKDILPEQYDQSFGNPRHAVTILGQDYGQLLSVLYAEIYTMAAAAFETRQLYLTIVNELFIEVYNAFEQNDLPEYSELKKILYWYASDYCDVFITDRILEQINPEYSFATEIVRQADWSDTKNLYRFGEYVTENELLMAKHIQSLPEHTVRKMADVYTEGFRVGFIKGNKDLSKKSVVTLCYVLGFEKVLQYAMNNFAQMGLECTMLRGTGSIVTKRNHRRTGYYGAIPNKQFDYDHRSDAALFLDKRFVERKLDVMKNVYEKHWEQAGKLAGPALIDVFGETPFAPKQKKETIQYSDKQEKILRIYDIKSSQLANKYMKGEERSFTVVAYPTPHIGEAFADIFDQVIRINTLDTNKYEAVQQKIIDVLDKGQYVHILGKENNKTDLLIKLYPLQDLSKQTGFENCGADVNIPVGEVFTSPMLAGTNGILHVTSIFLSGLLYKDLIITFKDGMITDYNCKNFEDDLENKKYIRENILRNQDTLPLGEFAIGTNTTAYVIAEKYQIADKLPVLIAEKMGPHFAVGDTCYSWSEEVKVYNSDGKEIVARDNEISILRKESVEQAYFNCHTDITIPYEELGVIDVVMEDGSKVPIAQNGRFTLPGTELLNEPFSEMN